MYRQIRSSKRELAIAMAMLPALSLLATAARADAPPQAINRGLSAVKVVKFDVSPPLRSIPPIPPELFVEEREVGEPDTGIEGKTGPQDIDKIVQTTIGPPLIPTPAVSFNGPANTSSVSPPDPVGDVGPNHYVAMSNLSFQIFNKTGTSLYGPALNNTLWSGFGGACQTENSGDPIVIYDQLDDRWLLSQFTAAGPTYFICLAVSQTADPTGSYYRYAVSTGTNFPDYPKMGMWHDALYISTREFAGSSFAGVGAYAVNRAQMIAGNPAAQIISFLAPPSPSYNVGDGLLPADLDGSTLPPTGAPNYFLGSMDNGGPYGASQDALSLWKFHADFTTPANSTFTLTNTLPVSAFDSIFDPCGGGRACIPQPSTTNKLDILSYRQRAMHRLAYRNFGTHESLVTNQSVEATANIAGIRWWEIRSPNSSPTIFQEGTYAPGATDGIHRWMGSIAMDSAGNMALGYSASNGTSTFPSVWYTGRLSSDAAGTMTQGEASIINGTGSQTGSNRWGDYSSMNVDPTDDCTFWYVNEYVPTTSSIGWQLRIGSFKFNQCGTPDFYLAPTPLSQEVCSGTNAIYDVTVGSISGFNNPVTLSTTGNPGTAGFSTNPVTPPGSSTLTISGAAAGAYTFNLLGNVPGAIIEGNTHQVQLDLTVQAASPSAATLTAPADGATGVASRPAFQWSSVTGATGYVIEVATDAGFGTIVDTATVATNSYTPTAALAAGTQHFWRVRATNACGASSNSSVFSFTTAFVYCSTASVAIPDNNPTGVNSDIVIPATGTITDLNVYIQATHTWVGDLIFTVSRTSPATSVTPFDRPGVPTSTTGCSSDNVDAWLDDEGAAGTVENACPPIGGLFYTPNNPLTAFDGQDLAGTWTLNASDRASIDTGTLVQWCIAPSFSGGATPTATPTPPAGATATPTPPSGPTSTPTPFPTVTPPPSDLVISQVYGAGGRSRAPWNSDYIEVFNRGSSPISLAGWSVQYANAQSSAWSVTSLGSTVLQPGQYYLVQEAGTSGGSPLPTPDTNGSIDLNPSAGKVALVNGTNPLSGSPCPAPGSYADLVSYGVSSNCGEGGANGPLLSADRAAVRRGGGCVDTNNNNADFQAKLATNPGPRNSSSPNNSCVGRTRFDEDNVSSLSGNGVLALFALLVLGTALGRRALASRRG